MGMGEFEIVLVKSLRLVVMFCIRRFILIEGIRVVRFLDMVFVLVGFII